MIGSIKFNEFMNSRTIFSSKITDRYCQTVLQISDIGTNNLNGPSYKKLAAAIFDYTRSEISVLHDQFRVYFEDKLARLTL